MKEFVNEIINSIVINLNNNYSLHADNWFVNENYFIRENKFSENLIGRLIHKRYSNYYIRKYAVEHFLNRIYYFKNDISYFEYLYDNLHDEWSKHILVDVLTYRILGPKYFRFKIENRQYERFHAEIRETRFEDKYIDINYNQWRLFLHEFLYMGGKIKCYNTTMDVVTVFKMKQYEFSDKNIEIEENDIIIDGGGCWGDTALFFANSARNAKVYSFEFVPSNITIFNQNIALNPTLNSNIELIKHALSSSSGNQYYIVDNGASSYISKEEISNSAIVETISIDDFVLQQNIDRINFIKLDIEGSEMDVLRGAQKTIKRFKPKLAIAVYHNPIDFFEIPKFILDLDLGYELFINHFTPSIAETILFARV